jgi:hypothetical protein
MVTLQHSAAMRRLLSDQALASQLGARASEMVWTDWNVCQSYQAYAAIYDEARGTP